MSNLGEIETALAVIAFGYLGKKDKPTLKSFQEAYSSLEGQKLLQEKVTLLHCTTEYPAPDEEINLKALKTLKQAFGLAVGFSDHSKGIAVPIAAVALGARVIEKHFTLSRELPGPDHKASLEGTELKAMIDSIRQVEKALGSNLKLPTVSEVRNKTIARKSLVAACNIKTGEVFSESNLAIKRPGNGIEPIHFWELMGQLANQDYEEDELIKA
jgi:N-acetylneuraminate synthase